MGVKKSKPKLPRASTETVPSLEGFIKMSVVGGRNVGITSIIRRLIENTYSPSPPPSTPINLKEGISYTWKAAIPLTRWCIAEITSHIWEYHQFQNKQGNPAAKGSHAVVIVYDITDKDSWLGVESWINYTDKHVPGAFKVIIGNKYDMSSQRQVPIEKPTQFCNRLAIPYFEISAKEPLSIFSQTDPTPWRLHRERILLYLFLLNPRLIREVVKVVIRLLYPENLFIAKIFEELAEEYLYLPHS